MGFVQNEASGKKRKHRADEDLDDFLDKTDDPYYTVGDEEDYTPESETGTCSYHTMRQTNLSLIHI